MPDEFAPILTNGETHALVRDLGGPGRIDVVIAAVRGAGSENRLEVLADISRLYVRGLSSPELFVFVYSGDGEQLEETGKYRIGNPPVFEGLRLQRLSTPGAVQSLNAVIMDTMRASGIAEEWLVFGSDITQPHRMTLRRTSNEQWRPAELGEEGVLDLLRYQRTYEHGSGIETFITRYVWDGRTYKGEHSIAVVRRLNAFLEECETLLNNREIKRFLEFAPEPGGHGVVQPELEQILVPATHGYDTGATDLGSEVSYVFPRVLQSPFPVEASPSFEFYVRALGAVERLYRVRVNMAADPFTQRPFFLSVQ